jgi:glycosyltransferase involved in cell wall biosynthesis
MVSRRAVLLVANPAAPYSRALRLARTLSTAGWAVEIVATTGEGAPREEHDGPVVVHRYAASGPFARWARGDEPPRGRIRRWVTDRLPKLLLWPLPVRGWWATLRRDLPPADLYHAFGILAVPVALELGRDARRAGRAGIVVYDVIDVILESNNYDFLPAPILGWYRWRERRWVRHTDAVVTVNDAIADHLERRWQLEARPTVLYNYQPRWTPPDTTGDPIREAAGLPPDRRIVLFLGRLGRQRGLEAAAEAVLLVEDAALVMMGFGPWADRLRARDADPRFAGRHVTLPPVHPDDVPRWTASADVSIVAVPADSLNQRLSTPNKFWESLTAGTPVVVGRDLEVMRSIVEASDLGAVADPADPEDLARALRSILDASPEERRARRDRCLAITRTTFEWEAGARPYLELVDGLVPGSGR